MERTLNASKICFLFILAFGVVLPFARATQLQMQPGEFKHRLSHEPRQLQHLQSQQHRFDSIVADENSSDNSRIDEDSWLRKEFTPSQLILKESYEISDIESTTGFANITLALKFSFADVMSENSSGGYVEQFSYQRIKREGQNRKKYSFSEADIASVQLISRYLEVNGPFLLFVLKNNEKIFIDLTLDELYFISAKQELHPSLQEAFFSRWQALAYKPLSPSLAKLNWRQKVQKSCAVMLGKLKIAIKN